MEKRPSKAGAFFISDGSARKRGMPAGIDDHAALGGGMLRQSSLLIRVRAARPGLAEFTARAHDFVADSGIEEGLLTLFCRHTSASLLIQENAAPAAKRDLEAYFSKIAPESGRYEHDDEGPDDMPAHLRTALTTSHLSVPVLAGRLALGSWQGIYLFEHRRNPPEREIVLHLVGQ